NQLARYLRRLGVGPNVITGLCVERSLESVIGILGILKAGGAYLPLDPEYPIDRLTFILQDAQATVLLTQSHLVDSLAGEIPGVTAISLDQDWEKIAEESSENLSGVQESYSLVGADDLAYVIYTSGSTGRPKGVMIEHRSAINLWLGLNRVIYAQLSKSGLKVSLNAPLPFDASVQEWLMLLSGHTLVVIPAAVRQDGDSLLKFIRENRIDVLDCVPSQLKMLISAGFFEPGQWRPRAVLPGGEAIDSGTWEKLASADQTEFFNMYGPTECTVDSTICQVSAHPLIPSIGKPIVNAQAYVLDRNLQIAPIGVAGELYLGGQGVARGYLNRPELTAERFISNPFGQEIGPEYRGERLYRTGDLVRYLPDGYLEYLGRVDFQVKLRGFRIELGEIESVLGQLPGVQDAVVIVREDSPGEKQLVAYLVAEVEAEAASLNVSAIRNSLKARLPEYMVPGIFVFLDKLPLTPNRKVDRKALPKPEGIRPELEVLFEAPRTEQEKTLAQIWSQVLKLDRIGIHDNFFDLGGDSILSIQVVARANQAGLRLTPRQIFEAQTIEALAAVAGTTPVSQAEQGPVSGPVALIPIQKAFFDQVNAQQAAGFLANPNHWNQAILLEVRRPLQVDALRDALQHLQVHHDALRMRYSQDNGTWKQVNLGLEVNEIPLTKFDLSQVQPSEHDETIRKYATEEQGRLNLANGPLMRVAYFDLGFGNPGRLLIVIHHLVIDGISWRILLQDLLAAYAQAGQGLAVQLPPKTTSFQKWSEQLWKYAAGSEIEEQRSFWEKQAQTAQAGLWTSIPVDYPTGENLESSAASVRDALNELETEALLREAPAAYNTEIGDILLAALVRAYRSWLTRAEQHDSSGQLERSRKGSSTTGLMIAMEGHGREDIFEGIDVTRTVGWFTSLYPLALTISPENDLGQDLMGIKEQLRLVPQKGLGYGLLRYRENEKLTESDLLWKMPDPQVSFNYLGQVALSEMVLPESVSLGTSGNLEQESALFSALEASKTTD
ncbi:MAG: amino acid adenylation domain-containing protein, partial [Anaerolineales bacterium]|nr:amino acid adenylation domain-containing protein [Anaerolineales bacterium]